VQPMPPRLRGERSTDSPWPQAACERRCGLWPRAVGRSPGPAYGSLRPGRHRLWMLQCKSAPFLRVSGL